MKVGAAIYSMLKDDSAVSALVGTRIYPELAEEGAATPYVVYSVVSNTPVDTKESAPVDEAQLEVFSVADTYAAANDLADKVRAALARKGKKVYGTVTVQSVKYTNEVTEVSAERNMYISVQDYTARLTPVIPNLLLNQYANAAAAYSLRRLNGDYVGPIVEVRRGSDDATLNVGYNSNNLLNTDALEIFCAGTTGWVRTWFDQSGAGLNVVQTGENKQPQIVAAGSTLVDSDNLPILKFDGSAGFEVNNTNFDIGSLSSFVVGKYDDTSNQEMMLALSGSVSNKRWYAPYLLANHFNYGYANTFTAMKVAANTNKSLHALIAGSTQGNASSFYNGTLVGTQTLSSGIDTSKSGIGIFNDSLSTTGNVQEVVIYASDQSANRTGIESNINTHYGIY